MSSNFDWRAEDDHTWDEYSAPDFDNEKQPSGGKRPTRLFILGALIIVVTAGTIAYFLVRRYVDNTAASVEEDVLSSHALVKLAAEEKDLELLAPLLSGRDPNWTQDQLALLDMDLLLDRQPFGLTWMPKETADNISVTLSPNLQSAEIEYTETYGFGPGGEEGRIELTQTAVYRLSETRWLLSPPDDDFWGGWISSRGRYVTLTFPERDDEIGRRLASDLEATLAGACLNLKLECDNAPSLDVLLATDLDAMMNIHNQEHLGQTEDQFVLPTPTLVGKPASNASYRALYRAYADFLVSQLVSRQAGWDCCDQSVFFNALLDIQLQQLSLKTWPLKQEDYRAALRKPLEISTIRAFWEDDISLTEAQERPDFWMLYAFTEFLLSQEEDFSAVIELQRALARSNSFNNWLTDAGITGNLNLVERDWRDFIFQKIDQFQGQSPISLPEEDITLICNDGQTGITNVYRYDPAETKWTVEFADQDFVVMSGLPGNQGLILTEQFLDVDQLRTTLWLEGQEIVVYFGEGFLFSAELFDPTGRYIVINLFQPSSIDQNTFESSAFLLELENCLEDDCPIIPIEGKPVWSPDGSRTLWSSPDLPDTIEGSNLIFLGNNQLQDGELVGPGSEPFWLDNENYAFVNDRDENVLMAAGVNDDDPEQLLEVADLTPLLPEIDAADLLITGAGTDPLAPDLIFLTIANRLENIDYVITFNWRTGEKKLTLTVEDSFGGLSSFNFSPNHRWQVFRTLAPSTFGAGQTQQEIFLYDNETRETQRYNLPDDMILPDQSWSNDGRWLLFRGQNFLMLSAPEAGYDHLVRHDFRDCTGATWIK